MTRVRHPAAPRGIDPEWSTFSKVNHRLQLLDSPDPNGWTVQQLATEYGVSTRRMQEILTKLVREGYALITNEGGYIGS